MAKNVSIEKIWKGSSQPRKAKLNGCQKPWFNLKSWTIIPVSRNFRKDGKPLCSEHYFFLVNWQVLSKFFSGKQSDRLPCVYGQWTSSCIAVLLLKGSFRYEVLWSTHRFSSNQSDVQPEEVWLRVSSIRLVFLVRPVNTSALSSVTGKMDRIQTTSPKLGWFALFLWT